MTPARTIIRCAVLCGAAWFTLLSGGTASVAEVRLLPVPSITLYPGDAITPAVLGEKKFKVPEAAAANFAHDLKQFEGKFAKRTLPAGRPIPIAAIRGQETVRQGEPAFAIYRDDGLVISTRLMPLQSGEAGQRIQARNIESGQLVQAEVQADGSLLIGQP